MRKMGTASGFTCGFYVLLGGLIFFLSYIGMAKANKVTFEKMTNRDYAGTTYYTIRNVSLYECLGKFFLTFL